MKYELEIENQEPLKEEEPLTWSKKTPGKLEVTPSWRKVQGNRGQVRKRYKFEVVWTV